MSTRRVLCLVLTLLGFGLRVHDLGAVSLRWDEGWSIGLARLPLVDMLRLTALDVHPPLYYLTLAPWLGLAGSHEVWVRFLSVAAGTAAVPLAAWAAERWWEQPTGPSVLGRSAVPRASTPRIMAVCAALYTALAPALVYYGGVARMYALTSPFLFGAVGGLAGMGRAKRPGARWSKSLATFVVAAAGALHTFYYTGFALAGLLAGMMVTRPRLWRRWITAGALLALAALPWLSYALPLLAARVESQTAARGGFQPAAIVALLPAGWRAALFAERWSAPAMAIPLVVLAAAVLLARGGPNPGPAVVVDRRREGQGAAAAGLVGRAGRMGLAGPVLAVLLSLAGAAAGAQGHMFADRYAIVATPFVALGLAWAVGTLWERASWLGAAALVAVCAATLPTLADYVYAKTAEVTEAFDPSADWRALHGRADAGDAVVFNILSLAGLYDRYRAPSDPSWSFAQLWDPVHEPLETAQARLRRVAAGRATDRFWLVLYKGTVSADSASLKDWADAEFVAGEGWWQGDVLYQSYITAGTTTTRSLEVDFEPGVRLSTAAFTGQSRAGGGVAVRLEWQASRAPDGDAKVFVHAYGAGGRLVAQHDGAPALGRRPTTSWSAGERVSDPHGLWLPRGVSERRLRLVAGLYDPANGRRWRQAGGADSVELGWVELEPALAEPPSGRP